MIRRIDDEPEAATRNVLGRRRSVVYITLRAKMSETSRPLIITVGRRKISHLDELEQQTKESLEHCGVGGFAA